MSQPLTDRAALIRNRRRAGTMPVRFLHDAAIDEVQDRLSLVKKSFKSTAVISGFPHLWQPAFPSALAVEDSDTLDLRPHSIDLAIHAMALHWSSDPVGQLVQIRRALRPDGLMLCACLGGSSLHELRASLAQAEADLTGGLSPRVVPMGEIRDLGALLQRAGFALPVADSVSLTASYATPLDLLRDLRAMGEGNALSGRVRRMTRRSVLRRACEIYADSYGMEDGRIPASFDIIFLTGWAPDESQPQPLRPGSATVRLAEALGTMEKPLKD